MPLQFHESPFHATHDAETASKMALKMDLSIFITDCIKKMGLKQHEAAARLNVTQSRVSELANGKIEKFTLDAMMDMLDKLGFRTSLNLPTDDGSSPPQIVITQAPGG
ncbi:MULTISPECIES: helix-turn-helix domain-containing protein [Pseudomonas]|jgi:predicted XRE-type DNA-binding protein|uniref:Helix-turn-helix domain-containing protein n=1 Tax=Pseudomonas juntendi TaxID=2666183 RepID=A0ABD4YKK1_9PSED|nr:MULTISPECIES: helix-turn-helix transcriptional regulator [Pseudomonas]EGC00102.1 Cro/Cl family transcriptional regulator [Pseudomonas sp. TJI-51]MBA6122241.1 XRE family transcriptional regulator [Pseudomonas juntendi]MBI6914492.1 XRE family transcriptional regulator [Pseudomonas juntendi]MBR7520328.1 XRE family transcriptional regulator [Pseudomonas juntendi]MCF3157947.1 helix-turn-helix domain-containing protein [Pseudomonas juntendi]